MNGKFVWHSTVIASVLSALSFWSIATPVQAQNTESERLLVTQADSAALSRVGGGRVISLVPHQAGQEVWFTIEVMHGNHLTDVVVNPRTDVVLSVRPIS